MNEENNVSSTLLNSHDTNAVVTSKNHELRPVTIKPAVVENGRHTPFEPPDGTCRGWIILLGAFLCNGVIFGIINTYSVIYVRLQKSLEDSGDHEASSKAALVGSLTIGSTFFLSPISGILVDKIGLRLTTIVGGILCAAGMLFSSFFSSNVTILYFTYGVMFGSGAALAYTPSLAILGHYFKKYLGIANGFVTAGSSAFTCALPELLKYLINTTDLGNTFRVMSVIASFIIVCGLIYKPLQPRPPVKPKDVIKSKKRQVIKSLINFENWKKRKYLIWAFSIPTALFGYFVPYVHMAKFVELNFPDQNQNIPIMCIGISSLVGRLIFGVIADIPRINRIALQQIAFVFIGLMTLFLPLTGSFTLLCIFALGMGLFDGCFISLLGPIAYDICGQHGATQAIGFLLGLCSIPLTVGPPLAGLIYDHQGSYTWPFILAGLPPLVGASLMTFIHFVKPENTGKTTIVIEETQTGWTEPEISNDVEEDTSKPF